MRNTQNVWWREYRKRLYKPNVRNMSIETVLRINFRKTSKEYFENSSLAGVQRMCDRSQTITQRVITIVLLIAMLGMIAYFLQNLWFENLARPLIVNMESTTYPISNIEFPAVVLCNFNRISKKALEKHVERYLKIKGLGDDKREEVFMFFKQLGRLVDFSYNNTLQAQSLLHTNYLNETNIVSLMKELAPNCSMMLKRCAWAGAFVECEDIFDVQRTVHGHCCAFNLVLRDDRSGGLYRTIDMVKRQHQPGQTQGLNVILDAMVDDYAYTTFNMYGFEVLIFDASHYADLNSGSMIQRIAQPNQAVTFEINTVKQVATREVRKYPPKTVPSFRKCLFHDELKDEYFNMYSYSACIVRCRVKTIISLCKCIPYYIPTVALDSYPNCTIDNLKCLNRYKEKLFYLYPKDATTTDGLEAELQDALYCAECLPDCELTRHYSKHSKIPLTYVANHNKELSNLFFKDLNMTGKCFLSIYQATADGVLNRLDIVSYWFEIVKKLFYLYPKDATTTDGLEAELQDALYCAECLPDCELTRHYSKHSKIPLTYVANHNKELSNLFFKDLNMTGKCFLSIYQATADGVLNRLDIVSYWFEIVSNVGGFCGVLIGFSLISILEFVYFFVFRFFGNLYNLYYDN